MAWIAEAVTLNKVVSGAFGIKSKQQAAYLPADSVTQIRMLWARMRDHKNAEMASERSDVLKTNADG